MSIIFKFLCFSVCLAAGASIAGCSSGDNDDEKATGGTGGIPGGNAGGGAGGAPAAPTKLFTFDSGETHGFVLNNSVSADPMYVNLAAPGSVQVPEPPPSLDWASKDFDGSAANPGSLKITALFSGWNQSVSVEVAAPLDSFGAPLDLSDKALRARVFLQSGLSEETDAPGGAIFFIKTGADYAWGQAPWKNLDVKNQWVEVRFDTKHPDSGSKPEFNPEDPAQMGFQFSSGGGNMHPPEDYPAELETIIYVDHITAEPCTPILCPG
jgi:hypothetical protein